MYISLILNNFENEHEASCIMKLNSLGCRYEYPEIREIFSSKILEYNWQEEQTKENAINILQDSILDISEGIINLLDIKLIIDKKNGDDFVIDEPAYNIAKSNIIKGSTVLDMLKEFDNGESSAFITFTKIPFAGLDHIEVELAKEDEEEVR